MSAESDNIRDAFVDELSSFEDRLEARVDEVGMLADVEEAIGRLLGTTGGNEAQIRRVLQDRYDNGHLRKETFQLVKSMLDRFVTEQVPTKADFSTTTAANASDALLHGDSGNEPAADDEMSSTLVLPVDTTIIQAGTADDTVQVGSILRDRFMLQDRVTGGSMGVVYKALDRRLAEGGDDNAIVAVKILSPHLAENDHAIRALQQEAAKGRCLAHPNIVRFIDLDKDDDLYFIVMEWLEGRTLADILDSTDASSIDLNRAFEIVRQIGKALEYAHRCGIVHADVKPGNIMIAPDGSAKLFDFGVARVRQKTLQHQPDFDPGVLGLMTPAYSSMQVLTGESPAPADDVFSLACLLYRLVAGYRVFGPRNAAEAAEEGMKPQRLQSVSDEQWKAIKKALSYSRVTRFESMADFLAAIGGEPEVDAPVTISAPPREDLQMNDGSSGGLRWFAGLVILAGLAAGAEWKFGLIERLQQEFMPQEGIVVDTRPMDEEPIAAVDEASEVGADESVGQIAEPHGPPAEDAALEDPVPEPELADLADAIAIEEPADLVVPLVDFSKLPPPTAEIDLALNGGRAETVNVRLRENGSPVTIDLVRDNVEFPLTLRLEEVSFSGNRSPWAAGQFEFSDNGFIELPVGQSRARVTLTMTSDPVREADQQTTLRVRESDSAVSELAIINAVLEDDDQRAFEATLPPNTVGFASSQVSVREQDPAVQIDILRFNPDNTSLVVGYELRDITATQGEDYFAPGRYTIEFGPGQRSARLLIPLVQDSEYEDNEAFSVTLSTADPMAGHDIYHRTAVMIRDDDI